MCTAKFLKGPRCGHAWAEIAIACKAGRGFSNCPSFSDGRLWNYAGLRASKADEDSCPVCGKKNKYDGNKIRVVKQIDSGYRWGFGPGQTSGGVDMVCRSRPGLGFEKKAARSRVVKAKGSGDMGVACCVVM